MFRDKKKLNFLFLILILLLSLFFRLKGLASRDIWYDEALDVIQSEKSILQITHDVPTPFHYYIVHFFLNFGRNTFVLGLPSVIFGLGAVYLLFLIGKKIANENLGLIAAFLLAISPMHIEFSQQILHYSYFVFFTLLSLFFYLDFILAIQIKKIKWKSFGFFIAFSFINFLTHIPALLVFAIEIFFLFFFLLINYRISNEARNKSFLIFLPYKKYFLFLIPVFLIIGYLIFFFNGGYYWQMVIVNNLKFNPQIPIQLGFSLSKQLNITSLRFNLPFFTAMFAWFGLGKGFRLFVYFLLFLIGLWALIKKRNFTLLAFYLSWIIIPFVYLYFVRLEHWFEEKYFIFIIPVYLLLIAEGIIFISRFLAKNLTQIIILFFIFCLALNPIKIRTAYGFPVKEDAHYSWRAVYKFLQQNIKPGDRVFVRRGEGVMPQFYFGSNLKNKVWLEENYVLSLSAEEYQRLTEDGRKNYFVTIPEFSDTFLANITRYQLVAKVGQHNIYQINFLGKNNLQLVANGAGEWGYYDDFSTAKYVIESDQRLNLTSTYAGNYNLPITYGFYNLSPQQPKPAQIVYRFNIPQNEPFFIKPFFFLDKGASLFLSLSYDGQNWQQVYQQKAESKAYSNPLIRVEEKNLISRDFLLKIEFVFDKQDLIELKNVGLKSIWLFNQFDNNRKDYQINQENKNLNYFYQAGLETVRSYKWLRQTVANEGWIQSIDGVLFRLYGQPEENPLVYKFNFPKTSSGFYLDLKTCVFNNELDVYTKVDDKPWQLWPIKNDNEIKNHQFSITGGKNLDVKFICQKEGPTCQLRQLNLNAKVAQ